MTEINTDRVELHRNVVCRSDNYATASAPDGGTSNVEVTVTVKFLPHGENELIAHYLTNQVTRRVVAEIDRQGLVRANSDA